MLIHFTIGSMPIILTLLLDFLMKLPAIIINFLHIYIIM